MKTGIFEEYMLEYIDGFAYERSRHNAKTATHYTNFAKKHSLLMTGGNDCHQKPLLTGTLDMPVYVTGQCG